MTRMIHLIMSNAYNLYALKCPNSLKKTKEVSTFLVYLNI